VRATATPPENWRRAAETGAYLAVVYALSWPLLSSIGDAARGELLVRAGMCVPGIVAVILGWWLRRDGLGAFRVGIGRVDAWAISLVGPPLLASSILATMSLLGRGQPAGLATYRVVLPFVGTLHGVRALVALFGFHAALTTSYLVAASVERFVPQGRGTRVAMRLLAWSVPLFVGQVPGDVGEELGWRGYVFRRWEDRPRHALVISAVAWAAFHAPLLHAFASDIPARARMLMVIALVAVPMAALYRYAGSFWPCAVAHSGLNLWSDVLLGDGGNGNAASNAQWSGLFGWSAVIVFAVVAGLTFKSATSPVVAPSVL
jgi:hypothetical protein